MSSETPILTEKQLAFETLRKLRESATLEQISEEMAILAAIRRGEGFYRNASILRRCR
jgi:hypothetical protein